MHGDGWAHAWQSGAATRQSAEIVYVHERAGAQGGWPFRYRARQHYRLDETSFSIRISLENLEDRPVPAGIGLHPFFVREPDCTLTCRTAFVWRTDAEVLPIERIPVPPEWDFRPKAGGPTASCSTTASTAGTAVRRSPGRRGRLRLDLEASEPFRHP